MAVKPSIHHVFEEGVIAPTLRFAFIMTAIIIVPSRMFGILCGMVSEGAAKRVGGVIARLDAQA